MDDILDHRIAYGIVVFCLIVTIGIFIHWLLSLSKDVFPKLTRINEAFRGTKDTFLARSFPLIQILRANVFVVVLTVLEDWDSYHKLIAFVSAQAVFLICLIAVRPLKSMKDMAIEIIVGVFFLGALGSLFYLNSEDRWTTIATYVYLASMFTALGVCMIITLGKKFL